MSESVDLFQSFNALQAAHDDLLERYELLGDSAESNTEFWTEVSDYVRRAQATGALFHPSTDRMERRATQSILDYWVNMLYRAGQPLLDGRLVPFDEELAPELPAHPCPYQGLSAFDEGRHEFFFGRDRLVEQMVEKLGGGNRMLLVVGASGSGKSSVVRAGLLPALKRGTLPGSESWCYLTLVPGADAMGNLDGALKEARDEAARSCLEAANEPMPSAGGPECEADRPPEVSAEAIDQSILLVVDQFEELFTLCDDKQTREAFAGRLLRLVDDPQARHVVILTIRIDFEDNLAKLPDLYRRLRAGRVDVGALSIDELRDTIEKPAAKVRLKFETGIVDDLIATILGERAGLPLLQFTLLQLWAQRDRNRVTKTVYESVGNPRQALGRSADAFLETLIPQNRTTVKRVLLQMVRPGEGSDVTSNRVPLSKVLRIGPSDQVEPVVHLLVCKAQLVKLSGVTADICGDSFEFAAGKLSVLTKEESEQGNVVQIEVAHEALVRNWPTLEKWLEEEWERLVVRRRLDTRAAEWVRLGRASAGLLDEVQLLEAERWLKSHEAADLGYDEAVPALVRASRAAIDQANRKQAGVERLLGGLVVGLTMVGILAIVLAGIAFSEMKRANDNLAAAYRAQRMSEAAATKAISNLQVAQDSLATQEAKIVSQLTPRATPTVAPTDAPVPTSTATDTPILTSTATDTPIPASTATHTPTSAGFVSPAVPPTDTDIPTSTQAATTAPTAQPTSTPSATRNPGATLTAQVLATELSSIRATQTAVASSVHVAGATSLQGLTDQMIPLFMSATGYDVLVPQYIGTGGGFERFCVKNSEIDVVLATGKGEDVEGIWANPCNAAERPLVGFQVAWRPEAPSKGWEKREPLFLYTTPSILRAKPQVAAFIRYYLENATRVIKTYNLDYRPVDDPIRTEALQRLESLVNY